MATEQELLASIAEYGSTHLRDSPPTFYPREPLGSKNVKGDWEDKKYSEAQGCYAIFSSEGEVVYVGKASFGRTLGSRLVRFRYGGVPADYDMASVSLITVASGYQAASLEEYLINFLQPRYNKTGIRGD